MLQQLINSAVNITFEGFLICLIFVIFGAIFFGCLIVDTYRHNEK